MGVCAILYPNGFSLRLRPIYTTKKLYLYKQAEKAAHIRIERNRERQSDTYRDRDRDREIETRRQTEGR